MVVLLALLGGLVTFHVREQQSMWELSFSETFDTDVPLGGFPGTAYVQRWDGYENIADTTETGWYAPREVLSVHDGVLDFKLHTSAGRALGAAPIPLVDGQWGGQVYGRYEVRFTTNDYLPGYGAGWLLWPDSNDWNEGEMDFPEGGLDGTIQANHHCVGDPEQKCLAVDTEVAFRGAWHTAVIEWTPQEVRYLLDGVEVAATHDSPSTPFHLVLQTATTGTVPDPEVSGHLLLDSVKVWRLR